MKNQLEFLGNPSIKNPFKHAFMIHSFALDLLVAQTHYTTIVSLETCQKGRYQITHTVQYTVKLQGTADIPVHNFFQLTVNIQPRL